MTRISPQHPKDERQIEARRIPGARERADDLLRGIRERQIELGRLAVEVHRSGHFALEGAASVHHWLVQQGTGGIEASTIIGLGHAVVASPEVEELVRSGELTVERAAVIGRVLGDPRLQKPGDNWIEAAKRDPLGRLKQKVKERSEEFVQESTGVVEVSVWVREQDRENFHRARKLASRAAKKPLSDGQAFVRVVEFYLDKNDPDHQVPRRRRVGDTAEIPGSRYVPSEVQREIRARSGDRCEFPGCTSDIFIQNAHREGHADGGSREADNVRGLCGRHHTMFDSGLIVEIGTDAAGRPIYRLDDRVFHPEGPPGGVSIEQWESPLRSEARRSGKNGSPRDGPGGASFVGENVPCFVGSACGPPE